MYQLPLTMKVRAARAGAVGVEFECVVTDAKGENVRSVPLTMSPKVSAAEASAILQSHIDQLAKALLARKEAQLVAETQTAEEKVKDIESLVGREFVGSAVSA